MFQPIAIFLQALIITVVIFSLISISVMIQLSQQQHQLLAQHDPANSTVAYLKVSSSPTVIAVNPCTNLIYVANSNDNTVSLINAGNTIATANSTSSSK